MTVIKAALTQVRWTGDKESMIAKHEDLARQAAAEGVQVICFQELFYGSYFGVVQDSVETALNSSTDVLFTAAACQAVAPSAA